MMPRTVKQVYDDNPSTSFASTDLIYLGKSPYSGVSDSAILVSDIYNATNLQLTLGKLNTIQDISVSSSPQFNGISLSGKSITLGGNFTTTGSFTTNFTMTGNTSVTFPTTGTLATLSDIPAPISTPISGANGGTGVANTGLTINLSSGGLGKIMISDSSGNASWATHSGVGVISAEGTASQVLVNGTSGSAQTGAITLTLPAVISTGGGTFTGSGVTGTNRITGSFTAPTGGTTNQAIYADNLSVGTSYSGINPPTNGAAIQGNLLVSSSTNTYSTTAFVNGTVGSTSGFVAGDGSASTPSHTFANDLDCGMYRTGTNGIGLSTNGSAKLTIDSAGSVSTLSSPAFLGLVTSTQSNVTGNSTFYTVISYSEIYDNQSNFNPTTGVFTAPVTGRYLLCGNIYLTGCTVGTGGAVYIATSNRSYAVAIARAASNLDWSQGIAVIADMDVGDTATMEAQGVGEAGNTQDLFGSVIGYTQFSGRLAN
ncbi:MAG: hypothetical protein EKK56_00915 [Flavobacteriaceae bacterium]|nr:MAG: hypothetical protein EKK56_00915 [Flavobacteriaceae bacterium]